MDIKNRTERHPDPTGAQVTGHDGTVPGGRQRDEIENREKEIERMTDNKQSHFDACPQCGKAKVKVFWTANGWQCAKCIAADRATTAD